MSKTFKIRKGLDIKLLGEAEKSIKEFTPKVCAIKPPDFHGVFPKLLVKEGDEVKAGTPLFFDKYRENILFSSPVSGKVREIRRGAKRVVLEVSIEAAPEQEFVEFGASDPNSLDKAGVTEKLLKSGVWPFIRQRPYSIIANPDDEPKAIMIPAFDSAPLAPGYGFICKGQEKELQTGIDALRKLTSGKVHMNLSPKQKESALGKLNGVEVSVFEGPHPAGNVSTQINRISPINKGEIVWYLRPQDILSIGRLFLGGKLDPTRIIALTGSEVEKPQYYKTVMGSCIKGMTDDNEKDGKLRYISGNVLTGTRIEKTGFVGFYDSQVSVIPEGDHFEMFGWALPGFNKFSFYHSFPTWMMPKKKFRLDTNYHGGERAFILTGKFEQVFPLNIYPLQLIKSMMIEDIDEMENLGIYEVDEEDFALCEFISTSKVNIQKIVRDGIDLMLKEMS